MLYWEGVKQMRNPLLPWAVRVTVVLIAVAGTPANVFAQHGAGGFHGGGFHHGGAGYGRRGGYHGGAHWHGGYDWYGWHGGYGWRGAYWGHPYYGPGWGISVGFGWSYPSYYYAPYYYGPYYYAPYYPVLYSYPPDRYVRWRAADADGDSQDRRSAREPVTTSPGTRVEAEGSKTSSRPTPQEMYSYRRPVQNAIRALQGMPPEARRRQLESGRYANFSAEERALLARIAFPARNGQSAVTPAPER